MKGTNAFNFCVRVYVCVCLCEREREREIKGGRKRGWGEIYLGKVCISSFQTFLVDSVLSVSTFFFTAFLGQKKYITVPLSG